MTIEYDIEIGIHLSHCWYNVNTNKMAESREQGQDQKIMSEGSPQKC